MAVGKRLPGPGLGPHLGPIFGPVALGIDGGVGREDGTVQALMEAKYPSGLSRSANSRLVRKKHIDEELDVRTVLPVVDIDVRALDIAGKRLTKRHRLGNRHDKRRDVV